MGSVWNLCIDGDDFLVGKNYLDGDALVPFQAGDLERSERPNPDEPGEIEVVLAYRARARTIARRLEILGYTIAKARICFAGGTSALSDWERESFDQELLHPDGCDGWMRGDVEYPSGAQCHACGHVSEVCKDSTCPDCGHRGPASSLGDHFHGFPNGDPLLVLRCMVERCSADAEVTLDLSDLLAGGWISDEGAPLPADRAVIIVTEGRSDARILNSAFTVLFPDYAELFSFIDYETANARGGTAELFLGNEALTGERDSLRPIRWTGFNEKLGRCQGEVSGKGEVQAKFEELLRDVRLNPGRRSEYDFSGIEAIFEAICTALPSR
jgi:hypothetical protein